MSQKYDEEQLINYKFKNTQLLAQALTHSSFSNENEGEYVNNERLEFLGDAVLEIMISHYLFMTFPDYPEGRLTRLRSKVVCEEVLYDIAIKLKLGDRLVLGKGEEATGGRTRKSILADAVEALIAAVYLDSGFDQVKEVFLWMFQDYIGMAEKGRLNLDFKTRLQEIVQKENSEHRIRYNVYKEEGPDHDKKFYVKAYLDKKVIGKGVGKTKKASEQEAAKSALINRGSISEF